MAGHKLIKCLDIVPRSESKHRAKQDQADARITYFLVLCTFDYGDYLAQSSSNDPNETSREGAARQGDILASAKRRPSKEFEWIYEERGGDTIEGAHEILVG